MQAPNWIALVFICLTFAGCPSYSASLQNGGQGDLSKPSYPVPSKGAFFEALLNYFYHIYPSANTVSSTNWNDQLDSANEFTQGAPKRLYYAPRAGKRSAPAYEDVDDEKQIKDDTSKTNGEARWKRSPQDAREEVETGEERSRMKRDTSSSSSSSSSQPEVNSNNDVDVGSSWWWSKAAIRRSPFSPRLGKRDEAHYGLVYDDDDDEEEDDFDTFDDDDDLNDIFEDSAAQSYSDETEVVSPQRLAVRSALVPRLGKKAVAFSPRLGKRVTAFIPRLGKRGDFAFSPRLGKRGDFAFSPRLGKKADFAFSPRLGKRGDFAFSPRLGKKADFAFSPRLGKRGDFAFSPRLGKKSDFAFSPRLGKRGTAFIPRLGKRGTGASTSPSEDSWRTNANDVSQQLQQRSVAFSPRLG